LPSTTRPLKEIFLDGGKSGSNLDFLLADASVIISIAPCRAVSALGRLPRASPASRKQSTDRQSSRPYRSALAPDLIAAHQAA
jgi:hypothetical protein